VCSQAEDSEPLSSGLQVLFQQQLSAFVCVQIQLSSVPVLVVSNVFLFPRLGLAEESPNPSLLIIGVFVL